MMINYLRVSILDNYGSSYKPTRVSTFHYYFVRPASAVGPKMEPHMLRN